MGTPSKMLVPPTPSFMDWNSLALGGAAKINTYNPPVKTDAFITSIINAKADVHIRDVVKSSSIARDVIELFIPESEATEMTISREELDAKLGQNKAEVDSVAASMRQEIAEFRAFQAQQFSAITTSLSEIKGEMSSAKGEMTGFKEGMSGQISGLKDGLSGQIDGVKSSISTMQWMIGTVLAMIGIVAAILAIPGLDKII